MPQSQNNAQVAAAVAASSSLAIGQSAAASMALTYTTAADTMGLVMHNAVTTQHGMQTIARAATATTSAMIIAAAAKKA